MAEPLHYRNKAIASFATQRGKLVCGLYAEGTHRVLPGADCLLQEEILNKTLAAVLDAARACRWAAYDEDRGTCLLYTSSSTSRINATGPRIARSTSAAVVICARLAETITPYCPSAESRPTHICIEEPIFTIWYSEPS